MPFAHAPSHLVASFVSLGPHFSFPEGGPANEQIVLRWLHFVSGIIWIGLLYFFNLVGFATMKQLDAPVQAKVLPVLMTRAMWWFRWSALVTVIVGLRYFFIILSADAHNAGDPSLTLKWFGWWLLVWLVAYALIYPLQLPPREFSATPGCGQLQSRSSWWRRRGSFSISTRAQQSSNSHLSISVGGGIGLLMLLNAWGVVWRAQKRLIAWTRASIEQGTPMPAEAARLALWAYNASRVAFWLSFPMLFFMAAAEHYPFLSTVVK